MTSDESPRCAARSPSGFGRLFALLRRRYTPAALRSAASAKFGVEVGGKSWREIGAD